MKISISIQSVEVTVSGVAADQAKEVAANIQGALSGFAPSDVTGAAVQSEDLKSRLDALVDPERPVVFKNLARDLLASAPPKTVSKTGPKKGPAKGHSQKMTFDASFRETHPRNDHPIDFTLIDAVLPEKQRFLLDTLRRLAVPNGRYPPLVSQRLSFVAKQAGLAENTALACLKSLETKGLVKRNGKGNPVWVL